jgi:hypothetical protein
MQNGGLIIVSAGGEKVLFSFKQKSPGDHVDNDVILNALGITSSAAEAAAVGGAEGGTKEEGEKAGEEGKATPEGEKAGGEGEATEGDKASPEEESCGPPGGGGC